MILLHIIKYHFLKVTSDQLAILQYWLHSLRRWLINGFENNVLVALLLISPNLLSSFLFYETHQNHWKFLWFTIVSIKGKLEDLQLVKKIKSTWFILKLEFCTMIDILYVFKLNFKNTFVNCYVLNVYKFFGMCNCLFIFLCFMPIIFKRS